MGVKFETSWGVAPQISKITLVGRFFFKLTLTMTVLEGIFEVKF